MTPIFISFCCANTGAATIAAIMAAGMKRVTNLRMVSSSVDEPGWRAKNYFLVLPSVSNRPEDVKQSKTGGAVEGGYENVRRLVTDHPQSRNLPALPVEENDTGRSEQAEALEQCLVLGRIGGDIRLQQQHPLEFRFHPGVSESECLHFLARDAPVGVEIEHHRFAGGLQLRFESGEVADARKAHVARSTLGAGRKPGERPQHIAPARERAD